MAWASRALLLARLRPLPAAAAASCRFVRPLASSRSLLPARSPFSPDATVGAASIARYCTGGPSDDSLSDRGYDLLREQGFREEGCHLQTKPLREPPPPVTADDDGSDCEGGPDEDTSDSDYFDDDERLAKGPPETQAMPGCDFKHWLVVMEPPPGDSSNPEVPRDEIIHDYIKTLAQVVGSELEARKKIYSVSTRHYFAFGALISEELSFELKELLRVRWVLADSYLDVENKDYGGEPFINGEAVPYDPKYHKEWLSNSCRANASERFGRRKRCRVTLIGH